MVGWSRLVTLVLLCVLSSCDEHDGMLEESADGQIAAAAADADVAGEVADATMALPNEPVGPAMRCAIWANTNDELYRLEKDSTGLFSARRVGSFELGSAVVDGRTYQEIMFDLATAPNGDLYGLSQLPDVRTGLWAIERVDIVSGKATRIYTASAAAGPCPAWAMAFRPNGELYVLTSCGALFRVDLANPEAIASVARFDESEIGVEAYLTGGDLVFTSDDVLYASVSVDGVMFYGDLFRYDMVSKTHTHLGAPTIAGSTSATAGLSCDGLAIDGDKLIGVGSGFVLAIDARSSTLELKSEVVAAGFRGAAGGCL